MDPTEPPRRFRVGARGRELLDVGRLSLEPGELVTAVTANGAELDLVRTAWGFYATPSLNARMPRQGLRPALVRNPRGQHFVLAVEPSEGEAFARYLGEEGMEVVAWLDDERVLADIAAARAEPRTPEPAAEVCALCGGAPRRVHEWRSPPAGETDFGVPAERYRREAWRCGGCDHIALRHGMDLKGMYRGDYVDATYRGDLASAFGCIMALPDDQSDNRARVRRVVEVLEAHGARREGADVLDVGSGLAVFPAAMAADGWRVTALDPDPRAVAHAREVARVDAVEADFLEARLPRRYALVTLNKVVEHVADPVAFLTRARELAGAGGLVYVEVPDGPRAAAHGFDREEFFVEHLHAFSPPSLVAATARAGLGVIRLDRLTEPSGKHTLAAFCVADGEGEKR